MNISSSLENKKVSIGSIVVAGITLGVDTVGSQGLGALLYLISGGIFLSSLVLGYLEEKKMEKFLKVKIFSKNPCLKESIQYKIQVFR